MSQRADVIAVDVLALDMAGCSLQLVEIAFF